MHIHIQHIYIYVINVEKAAIVVGYIMVVPLVISTWSLIHRHQPGPWSGSSWDRLVIDEYPC